MRTSLSTANDDATHPAAGASPSAVVSRRKWSVVHVAAAVGAALAIFELYLLVKWVAGPNFQAVPSGPDQPPTWMKWGINLGGQVVLPILGAVCVYWAVARPWRRERRVSFEGLLVVAAMISSFYDPLSDYFNHWLTYNSYFFNRGTPMSGIPGWESYSAPGAQPAWPFIMLLPVYPLFIYTLGAVGHAVMRRLRARWPECSPAVLVAACLLVFVVVDLFAESFLMLRLGWYNYTGSFALFESTYSHNPLRNVIFVTVTMTAFSCLRFFRDDRGQTFVEPRSGAHR